MREKPRLRDLLRDLLGPYRLLSRSEVYIERVSGWHMDGLGCSGPMRSTMERSTTTGRLAPARLRGLRGQPRCAPTRRNRSEPREALHYARVRFGCEWTGWPQVKVAWQRAGAASQAIATVALYLQDHSADDKDLWP
eukprot:5333935-Prymnesium_polylepis.1